MASVQTKLELLKDAYRDEKDLDLVLSKLLSAILSQQYTRLHIYENDLQTFEARYNMKSRDFHNRFERGELGDAMDFFEWAGLYEIWQELKTRIHHLETSL